MELLVADAVLDMELFRDARSGIAEGLIAGVDGKFVVLDGSRDHRRDVRRIRGQSWRGEQREDDCKGQRVERNDAREQGKRKFIVVLRLDLGFCMKGSCCAVPPRGLLVRCGLFRLAALTRSIHREGHEERKGNKNHEQNIVFGDPQFYRAATSCAYISLNNSLDRRPLALFAVNNPV